MTNPIDIEIKDSVDGSIETKLASIAKNARDGHKALNDLKKALASLDASPLADLQRASATHTNALARELNAQARMLDVRNKSAVADARVALEKQKLATEAMRTATAEANAARAMSQSEAAALRLSQAQARTAQMKSQDARAAEQLASTLNRLKASVDPLGAALDRHNAELAQAADLYKAGGMDAATFAQYEATLKSRIEGTTAAIAAQNAALLRGVQGSKAATQAGLNLSRQFADIGVTAAMGMNPLMILIQQGPQIADAFATAKTQGLGFKDLLKNLGVSLGLIRIINPQVAASNALLSASNEAVAATATLATAAETGLAGATGAAALGAQAATVANAELAAANAATGASSLKAATGAAAVGTAAKGAAGGLGAMGAAGGTATIALTPLAAALIAILGVLTAAAIGFALFHRELSKGYPSDITDGLKLTEEQLERVKSKTVTFGDTFVATFVVIGRRIMDSPIGDALRWIGETASMVMDWITTTFVGGTAELIGLMVGAFKAIMTTWRQFPRAFGDMVITGVNAAIRAIEGLINKAADGLNFLIRAYNAHPMNVIKLPTVGQTDLAEVKNDYAGAAAEVGAVFGSTIRAEIEAARGAMSDFGNDVGTEALRRARARALEEAGKPNKGAGRKGGKSEEEKRADALAEINDALADELALMGMVGDALEIEARMQGIVNSMTQKGFQLTNDEARAILDKVTALQELSHIQRQLESIFEDATGAERDYQNGLKAAKQLLDTNRISAEQYAVAVGRIKYEHRMATDPMAAFNDELRNEAELFGKFGIQLAAATRIQAIRNDLEAKGRKLTNKQTAALTLQLEQRERELMINSELGELYAANQGAIEALTARTVALSLAHQQGVIGAEQYRIGLNSIAMEAANIAIRQNEMASTGQMALASLQSYMSTYQGMLPGLTQSFGNFFTTIGDGFANTIARSIVYAEDFGTAMMDVARTALTELIASLVKLGIQWLITQAIGNSLGAAATAASAAQGSAVAAAWAPAAAAVSLATMGANALPASAAMVSTFGLAAALSQVKAMKDGGPVSGPGGPRGDKIPTMLSDGEYVVNARATSENRNLLDAINNGYTVTRRADGGVVSATASPVYRSGGSTNVTNGGGMHFNFDFSGANLGGADPEELEERFMGVVASEMVPAVLKHAREQANEDMTNRFVRPRI